MANTKLVFLSLLDENVELEAFRSESQIVVDITNTGVDHQYNYQQIVFDVSTAIKLSKTLRTLINEVKEI